MSTEKQPAGQFRRVDNWLRDNSSDLFETRGSVDWFTRKHRERLIASGQFIPRRGPAGNLLGPDFENVAVEILKSEAKKGAVA
jgi:hypothetical protein